jgi:hypothetical protein
MNWENEDSHLRFMKRTLEDLEMEKARSHHPQSMDVPLDNLIRLVMENISLLERNHYLTEKLCDAARAWNTTQYIKEPK